MKEAGIKFSEEMVRAILEGRKTQTRRIMKSQPQSQPVLCLNVTNDGQPSWVSPYFIQGARMGNEAQICPYGHIGDRLWVCEKFLTYRPITGNIVYDLTTEHIMYYADDNPRYRDKDEWVEAGQMPKSASRITLEITGVRVERLQNISNLDAISEGIIKGTPDYWIPSESLSTACSFPYGAFKLLWESIKGAGSWAANPWVWVIEFKRIKP